jgi:hypothetical protein
MLTIDSDGRAQPKHWPDPALFCLLIEDKVWQHLGLTLKEFLALEAAGSYTRDTRPEVVALMELLCTGAWTISLASANLFSSMGPTLVPSPREGQQPAPSVQLSA